MSEYLVNMNIASEWKLFINILMNISMGNVAKYSLHWICLSETHTHTKPFSLVGLNFHVFLLSKQVQHWRLCCSFKHQLPVAFGVVSCGRAVTFRGVSPLGGEREQGEAGERTLWTVFIYPSTHIQTHTFNLPIMCTESAAVPGPRWAVCHMGTVGWSSCFDWHYFISLLVWTHWLHTQAHSISRQWRKRQTRRQGYWLGWPSNSSWGWLLQAMCGCGVWENVIPPLNQPLQSAE